MPNINKTYTTRIMTTKGIVFDINVSDIAPTTVVADGAGDYSFRSNNAKLNYKGGSEDVLDPIKSSSFKFPFVIDDLTGAQLIEAIFSTNADVNWYTSVWRSTNNGVSFDLFWWGYLSPITSKIPNAYYPYDWDLEALDMLAISRDVKIFSKPFSQKIYIAALGVTIPVPKFRFGQDRQVIASNVNTIYPKKNATVIEIIYSLLYDIDTDVTGNLNSVMYWQPSITPTPNTGALNHCSFSTWWYLFDDMPPNPNNLNMPIQRSMDVTIGEILKDICELFHLRIFQKDGDYYVIQTEAYQTGASWTRWKYKKGAVATSGNHPVTNGSDTITLDNYLKTVALTPSDPMYLEGSFWNKLTALWSASIRAYEGLMGSGLLFEWFRRISGSTNNLSDISTEEHELEIKTPENGILYMARSGAPGNGQIWLRNNNLDWTFEISVRARLELRNKFRWILEGTLFASDYNFLYGISYDAKRYVLDTMNHDIGNDHFKCKWIEVRTETAGLSEVEKDAITE